MEMLDIRENGTYVDATVGLGGHAAAVLSRLGSSGRLVGIDRDENALGYARQRLGNNRVALKKGSFSGLQDILLSLDIHKVDGILFDLGVSMMQLKGMERGFSFLSDSRLDMRMDTEQELTAWDIVNKYPEKEMERILREYGEDPYAKRTAKTIVFNRMKKKIDTCRELADIISKACGRRGKIHPATRAFQALRIEVNREMDELKNGLASAVNMLTSDGRLCVISYHSLEDRIVKNFIRESAREGVLKILTKKPLTPAYEEVRRNPSSRSAKLRGAEKL
ncbi:MAG: 16S rRNA (cytosine(1402)-N(4))-methyltransferase [Nitrospirae bacterium GWC2_46_6]|nr:MAG: 16S rRNA (cytosine(1402)-N(4))-methyltransferase [Nitrospirae bacterium GWC2_46_6]OGW20899.1 MAG: 16S rRNA (cytosine(1402)-N(4))-methyltransferase [Nitrospirae bacterium GWA2_46_11]OGW23787.1 MAG: 16S rRNA (cytosine(1402)-N(4))-methyltransferase [Nitrospirae bacterium GWB2_47_37]